MTHKHKLSCLAVAIAVAQSIAANAQESVEKESLEEVQVIGVRQSIRNSISLKRDSENIVEAISAEDIGSLPGISIAESLQQITGVSGLDTNGRIDEIGIRGLPSDFTMTTLNGREVSTTRGKRGVALHIFPGELVERALVYKTPLADGIEGGVAGTVELQTVRPLDRKGKQIRGSFRVENNSLGSDAGGNDTGARGSIAYVDQFVDDTVGFAYAFSGRRGQLPAQKFDISNYIDFQGRNWANGGQVAPGETFSRAGQNNPMQDTDSFRAAREAQNFPSDFEWVFNQNFTLQRRDREDNLQAHMFVFQFEPNENWNFNVDLLHSEADNKERSSESRINQYIDRNVIFFENKSTELRVPTRIFEQPIGIDEYGVVDYVNVRAATLEERTIIDQNGQTKTLNPSGAPGYGVSDSRLDTLEKSFVSGFNGVWENDGWRAEFDIAHSAASEERGEKTVFLRTDPTRLAEQGNFSWYPHVVYDKRDRLFPLIEFNTTELSNPRNFTADVIQYSTRETEDELNSIRGELSKSFDTSWITKVEGGFRYAQRERKKYQIFTRMGGEFGLLDCQTNFGEGCADESVINPDIQVSVANPMMDNDPATDDEFIMQPKYPDVANSDFGSPERVDIVHLGLTDHSISAPFLSSLNASLPRPFASQWYGFSADEFFEKVFPQGPIDRPNQNNFIPNNWTVEEDTLAAYVKLDFEGNLGSVPFSGGLGVRVINTQSTTTNLVAPLIAKEITSINDFATPDFTPSADQFTEPYLVASLNTASGSGSFFSGQSITLDQVQYIKSENDYTDVLPALNLSFELSEEFIVRLGLAQVLTRPSLSQLGNGLSPRNINVTDQNGDGSVDLVDQELNLGSGSNARGGNPFLEPFRADQMDVSFEYYFNDDSAISLGLFYKDVETFINTSSTVQFVQNAFPGVFDVSSNEFSDTIDRLQGDPGAMVEPAEDLGNPFIPLTTPEDFDGVATIPVYLNVNAPSNGEGGTIQGAEFAFKAAWDSDLLPKWMHNFGHSFAYTYTDVELNESAGGINDPRDLNGNGSSNFSIEIEPSNSSRDLLNMQLYWENNVFSIRGGYNFRSAFNRGTIRQKERGQFDISARYHLNDNLRFQFQVYNLTEEPVERFRINPIDDITNDGSNLPDELKAQAGLSGGYVENIPATYEEFGRRVFFGVNYNF